MKTDEVRNFGVPRHSFNMNSFYKIIDFWYVLKSEKLYIMFLLNMITGVKMVCASYIGIETARITHLFNFFLIQHNL